MAKLVVGLFDRWSDAEDVVQELLQKGITTSDISFIGNKQYDDIDSRLKNLLGSVRSLKMPGIGTLVIAGMLSEWLGLAGTTERSDLALTLVDRGVLESDARIYVEGIRRQGVLVLVKVATDDDAYRVAFICDSHNVVDIDLRGLEYRNQESIRSGRSVSQNNSSMNILDSTTQETGKSDGESVRYSQIYNDSARVNVPNSEIKRYPRIFISYRREETSGHAGRLYDHLVARFGQDQIFMDIDTIEFGIDFVEAIESAISACQVLLVVIGRQWLKITDSSRRRRLDNPEDFVRLEVMAALNRNIRVIPVLVQGATMPRSTDLPPDLSSLARRHALEISDARWIHDVGKLIVTLEGVLRNT